MVMLADTLDRVLDYQNLLPLVVIVGGLSVGIIAIVFSTMKTMYVARQREQTKRELAAYVAEGSLDADKAIALAAAGGPASVAEEIGKACGAAVVVKSA